MPQPRRPPAHSEAMGVKSPFSLWQEFTTAPSSHSPHCSSLTPTGPGLPHPQPHPNPGIGSGPRKLITPSSLRRTLRTGPMKKHSQDGNHSQGPEAVQATTEHSFKPASLALLPRHRGLWVGAQSADTGPLPPLLQAAYLSPTRPELAPSLPWRTFPDGLQEPVPIRPFQTPSPTGSNSGSSQDHRVVTHRIKPFFKESHL